MVACPACGGGVSCVGVIRHRWWVCSRCGTAAREPRRAGAPREVGYFRRADPEAEAAEARQVGACLASHGIAPRGRVLDVGGGPGAALAALAREGGVEEVLLLEYSPHARARAAELGVSACEFDFQSGAVPVVAPGRWDLVMVRYSAAWCHDLSRFAAELAALAAPGAILLLTWVLPGRGAFAVSQLEFEAPDRLFSERIVDECFTAAGWTLRDRFEPAPPMLYPRPSWRWFLGLPVLLRPGPARGFRQRQAGRIFAFPGA